MVIRPASTRGNIATTNTQSTPLERRPIFAAIPAALPWDRRPSNDNAIGFIKIWPIEIIFEIC